MAKRFRLREERVRLGRLGAGMLALWLAAGCNLILDNEKRSLAAGIDGDGISGDASMPAADSGTTDAGADPDGAIMSMMGSCDSPFRQCTPDSIDPGMEACGECGSGVRTRMRGCTMDCRWGSWSEWSDCQLKSEPCTPDAKEEHTESCGSCNLGTRMTRRVCTGECYWEEWQPDACVEPESSCMPGQVLKLPDVSCGKSSCGVQTQTRVCSDSCEYGDVVSGACDESASVCTPGQTRTAAAVGCNQNFCNKGVQQQIETCTSGCKWGAPTPMGACTIPNDICRPADQGGMGYRCRQGDPGYRDPCRPSTAAAAVACTYGPREKFSGCNQ